MTSREDRASDAVEARVWPPVLAVDPGATNTGICLRVGTDAIEAVTVERGPDTGIHTCQTDYAHVVLAVMGELVQKNRDRLNEEAEIREVRPTAILRAVETLVAPTARSVKGRQKAVAPSVLSELPGTGIVLGSALGRWPNAVKVAPLGKPGWDAVGTEHAPRTLKYKTPKTWLAGGQHREHQRSAWAIAGAAHAESMPELKAQVESVVGWSVQQQPARDAESLVALLREGIQQTGGWDLLERLPGLAYAVVATATESPRSGEDAKQDVEALLTDRSKGAA